LILSAGYLFVVGNKKHCRDKPGAGASDWMLQINFQGEWVMKKLVLMLGVLLIAGSGMAYAAGCCGGNGPQGGYSGVGLGVPQGGYGNASCCSFNSTTPAVNAASCCAPGGSNFSQRQASQLPMGSQFPRSN